MPSVAEEQPRIAAGKKRRRDNDANDLPMPVYEKLAQYSTNREADGGFGRPAHQEFLAMLNNNDRLAVNPQNDHEQMVESMARRILPLPAAKRARIGGEDTEAYGFQSSQAQDSQRRNRHTISPSHSRILQDQTDGGNRAQPTKTNSAISLSPCHICHRRPTKKSDLDSFADCQGCCQRTCFVCIRACPGWGSEQPAADNASIFSEEEALSRSFHMDDAGDEAHDPDSEPSMSKEGQAGPRGSREQTNKMEDGWASGGHRQMVCSRCCIEKGTEGDVVCLGCLSRMEAV